MKIIQAGLLVLSGALLSTLFQSQIAHSNVDPLAQYQDELIRLAKLIDIDANNNVSLKTAGALTVKAESVRLDSYTDVEIKAKTIANFYGQDTKIGKKGHTSKLTINALNMSLDSGSAVEIKANTIATLYGAVTKIGKKSYNPPVTQNSLISCPPPGAKCIIHPSVGGVMIGR